LAADASSIYELTEASAGARGVWHRRPLPLSAAAGIRAVVAAADGGLWIGTSAGLVRDDEGRTARYTTENGLSSNQLRSLLVDREGTLWIGTEGSGVSRLSTERVIGFTTQQGLPSAEVHDLSEDRDGRIYALVGCAPRRLVSIAGDAV